MEKWKTQTAAFPTFPQGLPQDPRRGRKDEKPMRSSAAFKTNTCNLSARFNVLPIRPVPQTLRSLPM